MSLKRKIQLGTSTANGSTLTEVGVAYGASSSNLATHAMLKDMNGNPISIPKTDTDIINVYATVYAHWNQSLASPDFFIPLINPVSGLLKWMLGLSSTIEYSNVTLTLCAQYGSNPHLVPIFTK